MRVTLILLHLFVLQGRIMLISTSWDLSMAGCPKQRFLLLNPKGSGYAQDTWKKKGVKTGTGNF